MNTLSVMNIVIFKTSVEQESDLASMRVKMDDLLGRKNWTFAFEDVDKILRVVSPGPCVCEVSKLLADHGFYCEELPYSLDEFKV